MSILTIEEGRCYARDGECSDEEMQGYLDAADVYVANAIGANFDPTNPLVKLLAGQLVAEFDDVHGMSTAAVNSRRAMVDGLVCQLQLVYK